jgi:hypothetical protein
VGKYTGQPVKVGDRPESVTRSCQLYPGKVAWRDNTQTATHGARGAVISSVQREAFSQEGAAICSAQWEIFFKGGLPQVLSNGDLSARGSCYLFCLMGNLFQGGAAIISVQQEGAAICSAQWEIFFKEGLPQVLSNGDLSARRSCYLFCLMGNLFQGLAAIISVQREICWRATVLGIYRIRIYLPLKHPFARNFASFFIYLLFILNCIFFNFFLFFQFYRFSFSPFFLCFFSQMTSTDIFSCSRGVERIFQNTVYRKLCVRSGA